MSNYETRHPTDMVLHPLSEIREWDEALAVLGIQDSTQTPADAIRERDAEIERLRAELRLFADGLTDLYSVARVGRDEDYYAVTNAAALIERLKPLSRS